MAAPVCKVYMKQGDTKPDLEAILSDADGVISLVGASISFHLYNRDTGTITVDAAADIVDAAAGSVKYEWSVGDTAIAGNYYYEFEITFGDGTILTVPNSGHARLVIIAELA